jgi:type II secretory pathway component PulJ
MTTTTTTTMTMTATATTAMMTMTMTMMMTTMMTTMMMTTTEASVVVSRRASAPLSPRRGQEGFTLVEMMIAAALTMVVVGAAVALATDVQHAYSYELDDAAVQQEARFALDWMSKTIAAGGSNPYDIGGIVPAADSCTDEEPGFEFDPDGDGEDDDLRVTSDSTWPNGLLAGDDGDCNEDGEDVTITHDDVNNTITRTDPALDGGAAMPMTDSVVTDLTFTYLDSSRTATADENALAYVQISLTVTSKTRNPYTNQNTSYTYSSEVRVRSQ